MTKTLDPFYNRKPVPDELIKDVGITGLTAEEEHWNREKKYTLAGNGVDVRRFSKSNTSGLEPLSDPYYGRKSVTEAEIRDVAPTGLSPEEEYWNRERKYSIGGQDVRKFSKGTKNSLEPSGDPYYSRRKVSSAETKGVGDLDNHMTPAEQFEVRERKQSMFQLSDDPFDVLANRHRSSVSGAATGASSAATRRRSSAVAPDAAAAAATHHHSGYDGGNNLETIESRAEGPRNGESSGSRGASEDTRDSINPVHSHGSNGDHTRFHDAVTKGHDHGSQGLLHGGLPAGALGGGHEHNDPDSVAPDEMR